MAGARGGTRGMPCAHPLGRFANGPRPRAAALRRGAPRPLLPLLARAVLNLALPPLRVAAAALPPLPQRLVAAARGPRRRLQHPRAQVGGAGRGGGLHQRCEARVLPRALPRELQTRGGGSSSRARGEGRRATRRPRCRQSGRRRPRALGRGGCAIFRRPLQGRPPPLPAATRRRRRSSFPRQFCHQACPTPSLQLPPLTHLLALAVRGGGLAAQPRTTCTPPHHFLPPLPLPVASTAPPWAARFPLQRMRAGRAAAPWRLPTRRPRPLRSGLALPPPISLVPLSTGLGARFCPCL